MCATLQHLSHPWMVGREERRCTHSRAHGFSLFIFPFSAGSYLKISSCGVSSLMSFARLNVLSAVLDEDAMAVAGQAGMPPHGALRYSRAAYRLRVYHCCGNYLPSGDVGQTSVIAC